MTPLKKQILWIAVVVLIVVTVDQTTKALVRAYSPIEKYIVIGPEPQFFRISHQENPGVVGGIFRENKVLAHAAPLLAVLVLLYLFRQLEPTSKLQLTAYGMIWGGAIGNNLLDRLRLGVVTDFLQFHFYFIPFDFPWKMYPAFNVADINICCGVFLLIVGWMWIGQKQERVSDTA